MSGQIGKYEVQSELGRGAFGLVYRAYDPVTRRNVAIKVLLTENDPDALARFFVEVQATAKLKHKNVVTIYDFNETPPYIVMELVEGESLQQIISRHAPFSLLQKVRILLQAAEGLASAHKSGIVHRDIKPANIMVLPDGDVKIMDFGIALVSGGETEARRTRQGNLIGTILYMSPERIQGGEADACGDIFSFGVVGWELITGQHPFEGNDYASVIYKITSVETPPVRELVPECPEALDLVIQRATAKDRDVRHQSMDEILFDLRPVLLELERQQAASIMHEVQGLIDSGQFVEAQEKVRAALELDPSNREARQVHDSLLKDHRRRLVRAKVETLVQEGMSQLAQRQFNKAIQHFETALRLESDPRVSDLLAQSKASLEANRQAGRLLSEARREMTAGNLDAAYENASLALQVDPQHQDAGGLCDKLRQQIARRDRQLEVGRALERAQELVSQSNFEGARGAIAEVEPDADPGMIRQLRLRIAVEESEQARRAREQRVHSGVAKATEQMNANLLAEAEATLHALLEEFPDDTSSTRLLAIVREHLEAQRRAEAIGKLTQQSLALLEALNFAEARRMLESGLETFPSDAALQRLLKRALDLQRGHERAQAIAKIVRQAQELRAAGKLADALARVGQGSAEFGPDTALADLTRELEFEHEQQQYAVGLREALANGHRLVDAGKFADAVAALEAAAARYLGEVELNSLLVAARRAQAEQDEQQCVAHAQGRVAELGNQQQWQAALECAEEALRSYPYNSTLSELTARTRENWRRHQRQYDAAQRRAAIEQALEAGNLTRAAHELTTAREDFREEPGFDLLEQRFEQARLQAQMDALEEEVKQSLASGDLERASQQLSAAQGRADHPRWQALLREVLRRQRYQRALQTAQQLKEGREYQAAEELLRPWLRDNPPDNQAVALLDAIAIEQRRDQLDAAYRQALEEAERLRTAGDFNGAQQILQQAALTAPDQRAADLLRTVTAERAQIEAQQRLEQGKREIVAWLGHAAPQNALATIERLEREFRGDPELVRFRAAAERQRNLAEARARIKELEEQRQFAAALGVVEEALRSDPENADLIKISERLRPSAAQQLVEVVRECLAKNQLQRAGALLDQSRQRWSHEPWWETLQRELAGRQAEESALREAERARGIEKDFVQQALSRIAALETQQKWDAALEEAERAVARYPGNTRLAAAAMEERRRKEMALCIRGIDTAIAARDWFTAEQGLKAADARFPGEKAFERPREDLRKGRLQDALRELGASVQLALGQGNLDEAARQIANTKTELSGDPGWHDLNRQLELHRRYQAALRDAGTLRLEGKYDRAEELLKQVLNGAPDTRAAVLLKSVTAERLHKERDDASALARQQVERDARAEKQHQEAERAAKVASCRAAVEAAVKAGHWDQALKTIVLAEQELPDDPVFNELHQHVAWRRHRALLDELAAAVRQSLARRDLDGAARQLAGARSDFSEDPLWQALDRELSQRRQYDSLLAHAQDLIIDARYDAAQRTLREAIPLAPADGRADALLRDIADEKNARLRLKVQSRLIVKKYRRAILVAGVAAGVLMLVSLGVFWPRTPVEPITIVPQPTELRLNYQIGSELPQAAIEFRPADLAADFHVLTDGDWLTVTPGNGKRLGRLEVKVSKVLDAGTYIATVLVRIDSRPVTTNPVLIPVRLAVTGQVVPKPVP